MPNRAARSRSARRTAPSVTPASISADLINISTGSTFYQTHGFVGVSDSKNGGNSWSTTFPGQASAWSTSGNVNYGDVLGGPVLNPDYTGGVDPNIAMQDYSYASSDPVLLSTPDASSTVLVSPFLPYCFEVLRLRLRDPTVTTPPPGSRR